LRAHRPDRASSDTGPIGPVAFSALLFLVAASPLMRGGNRQVALIVLEAAALAFLVAAAAGSTTWSAARSPRLKRGLLAFIVLSPAWLALVNLVPIPAALWSATAGREDYLALLRGAGISPSAWLPLSLVPDATAASLCAGIPLAAAFLAGYLARLRQLRVLLGVFVGLAFLEVVIGLLQMAGGTDSSLYFGVTGGRPSGTFVNANHFANYIGMALAAYVWLAWSKVTQVRQERAQGWAHGPLNRNVLFIWVSGGVLLALGVLMSRSRGAALGGLPAGLLAFALAVTVTQRGLRWRTALLLLALALGAAVSLVGIDSILTRFNFEGLTSAASVRSMLAVDTMEGAWHFWPWGAGWGTYATVFPRFQSPAIVGFAEYAHEDYAQLLFEGGVFALLLMAAFAWLAVDRAALLVRAGVRRRRLRREEMAAALCGLGLLGFLLHSLVEFNMHIPANAIAAALLAGIYLRPLDGEEEAPG
jgi:hypothetical protein